jgi:hypothetical protein
MKPARTGCGVPSMNNPCLLPIYRSEAFAEDLDPPAPLVPPQRRRVAGLMLALVPMVLVLVLASVVVRLV